MPLWQMSLAGRPAISSPLSLIEPAVGAYMPAMQLKVVLLPEPLGPIRPRISPSSTSNDTFETAVKPSNILVRPETVRSGHGDLRVRSEGQAAEDAEPSRSHGLHQRA